MRTRLTVRRPGGDVDVVVTTDAAASVGDVADAFVRAGVTGTSVPGSATLRVAVPGQEQTRSLRRGVGLAESGVRAGSVVTVAASSERFVEPGVDGLRAVARLELVAGPDAGRVVDLPAGVTTIGRGVSCDVRLTDQMVSKVHARVVVSDVIEVVDAGSSNGVLAGDGRVERVVVAPEDTVLLGQTVVRVGWISAPVQTDGVAGAVVGFNRSPRVVPRYGERTVQAPTPPEPALPGRFPLVALVAPMLMGAVLFFATRSVMSLVFVGLSPVLMIGTYLDKRIRDRQQIKTQTAQFRLGIDQLVEELTVAHGDEQRVRAGEEPCTAQAVDAAMGVDPILWCRRPLDETFLTLHLGIGSDLSRTTVQRPPRGKAVPALWADLEVVCDRFTDITDVPMLVSLRECGSFGVAGPQHDVAAIARAVVAQLVCLHSPAELIVVGVASPRSAPRWDWLKWLPHTASPHSPINGPHLSSGPAVGMALVTQLEEVVAARRAGSRTEQSSGPAVVLVVEDDAPLDRGRLVQLAVDGPAVGVHVVWCAPSVERLPAACRAFVSLTGQGAQIGVVDARVWRPVTCEPLDTSAANDLARHLCAVVDAGAPILDESDVPRSVSYLAIAGADLAEDASGVVDRWRETGSLLDRTTVVRRTHDASLRALVGVGADGDFMLDLRAQGPHALVGGTTGAGKSEFLQAWVLGMAAAHSPDRVTFLFVDYKGGAAFADCLALPHCVGLVTDLSPHLVRRALASLRAELRHREELLNARGAKDLLAMERAGDPQTPPALVIVIDEFAALVAEVPEFVDGVVDIAQRGRSLGLHLVLATQRPAGVIKDNLRANTNLRVALRMADEHDSTDVLGVPMAAHFDPAVPGRGAVRTGPGRVAMFQTGYAGGRSTSTTPPPRVAIETLTFGPGDPWDIPAPLHAPSPSPDGPTDITRAVATIAAAAALAAVPHPRRPWLPELPPVRDLETLGTLTDAQMAFGVVDVPEQQAQQVAWYRPDHDGTMAVFGTSGSGKTTLLRTLAAATTLGGDGGPVHVYGIDAASGALAMIEALPNVGSVVEAADTERVTRLLRQLRETLDDRATRYAAAHAATIGDYRTLTGRTDEPRILVLLDGLSAFRDAYENDSTRAATYQAFVRVVAEGRPLGVHVVMTAERPGALPSTMAGNVQRRLVMRQADENAYLTLGAPKDALTPDSPPGRGVMAGTTHEIQVAVPGGFFEPAAQAQHLQEMATGMLARGTTPAPAIGRLAAVISQATMPDRVGPLPVLGIADDTLAPVGIDPHGTFLVAGPPGSGRTTALTALATAIRRHDPAARLCYFGNRRSPVHTSSAFDEAALTVEDVTALAKELLTSLLVPPEEAVNTVLVVESINEFLGSPAEQALTEAVRTARRGGHLVIAEAETPAWGSAWPLISEVRNGRRGLVLQPDQIDGEGLFRTPFPRMNRAASPPGRGILVQSGRLQRVQIPLPDPRFTHPRATIGASNN